MFKKFLFIMLLAVSGFINAQIVTKVLISGENATHDTDVKNAFLKGYASFDSTQYTGTIVIHADYAPIYALRYAHNNGYQIAVRSYTGLNQAVDDSAKAYPDVQLYMPAGSNSFIYICELDMSRNNIVVTGAGIDTLVTGYPVEFYSIDPITGTNLSSYSNGYVAGQIAFIANHFNISLAQARIVARNNSIKYQGPQYVVYGKLNKSAGISILPVELTSFTGKYAQKTVHLNWSTATEVSNMGFDIERSTDKLQWKKIGFVTGHGNSNSPKNYSYSDNSVVENKYYYRLKQIDTDGKYQYSKVIEISKTGVIESCILSQNYPNPFNPTTNISFSISSGDKARLTVYDILGKEVAVLYDGSAEPGKEYSLTLNASNWVSGVYFYKLVSGSSSTIRKMLLLK